MVIRQIRLQNFRSYQKEEFKFLSGITLVVGANTSGKTNLLEAIGMLCTGKSFRAGVEKEVISYGKEIARIGATTEETKLEIVLTTGQVGGERAPKKRYLVNDVGKRKLDFVGNLRTVLFRPEDMEIIIDSPSTRRHYLDDVLELVDREYRRASLSYLKGLRQRNRLLDQIRDEGKPRSALYFWDRLLIENGKVITQKRGELIEFVNQHFGTLGSLGNLRIRYDRSMISSQRLEKYAREEVAAGMTLVGPHRDNMIFVMRNAQDARRNKSRDLSVYGSRGEQRLAVFALKLAELEFVAKVTGSRPGLLLDDIFSELDHEHRAQVLEVIPKQQTIITATDLRLIPGTYLRKAEKIEL